MIDPNNFNFQDFTQGQNIDFGENQVFQGDMEQNQEGNTVDLANFTQDNGVLQATAGLEGLNNNVEFLGQNNELQTNTMDSDALMGETLKTGTVVPDFFGQNFQGTTTTNTTNVVEGNIDPNTFFGNTNVDTNALFRQTENIQTTTDMNNYGEGLIIQGNEANAFIGETQNQNQIDFGAIQTEQTGGQNIFGTYQASGTNDVNSIGYGTMEMQAGAQLQPIPFSIPETQTQTTTQTTTQTVTTQPALNQFQTQNIGEQLDFEAYPATNTAAHHTNEKNEVNQVQITNEIPLAETQYIPNFDITHFQQTLDATPLATSHQVTTTQTQITPPPQVVPQPGRKVVATPQPIVQATYTPPPQPVVQAPKPVIQTPPPQPIFQAVTAPKPVVQTTYKVPQVQTTTITTPTPVQVIPQQQTIQQYQYQTITNPIVLQSQTQLLQTGIKPVGNPLSKGLVDEDFRRGRPVYNEVGVPSTKLKIQNNQLNTYAVKNIVGFNNNNKIGMSKLAHAPSYNIKLVPPSLNLYNQGIKTDLNTNLTNNLNNQVNTINTNVANNLAGNINTVGNTINNVTNNINTELDKVGKASSYNVGQQVITPLLNNVGLGQNNIAPDNTRLVQLKDFL